MSERTCPVPGCRNALGATRQGDPWAFCRRHYGRLPNSLEQKLWRAYRTWQRLERQRMRLKRSNAEVPDAVIDAIAVAISDYLDIRSDCIRAVADPDVQLEIAQ